MSSVRNLNANDQLSQVKKQISQALDELDDSKCFELPRSLSMERLSLKKLNSSESVASILNSSNFKTEPTLKMKHVTNTTSIFTPDPFSTASAASQTMDAQRDLKELSTQTTVEDNIKVPKSCIQKEQESQTTNQDWKYSDSTMEGMMDGKRIECEMIIPAMPKISESIANNTDLETVKIKLRKAEMEINSLVDQNRIISAESQKLIVHAACKREDVTKEREVLYGVIHDFLISNTINNQSMAKSLVDQISKNLYSLIEHSNDVAQLDRIKDLFLCVRESVVKISNESIYLDHRISNLEDSSNAIRFESETIISQLEEKSKALMNENQELHQKIKDLISERTATIKKRNDDHLILIENVVSKNEITESSKQEKLNVPNQDQEIIKSLRLENETLQKKLLSLNSDTQSYPLSDLYEKIVALVNRDASSGINIKELLEWVEEKRVVIQELEKIKTSYSNLSFKHKHLIKEYSDQKSIMDEIQKRITIKESEWQSKFKEFTSNANQLEARHSNLQAILCDYVVQYQGVLSLSSNSLETCTSDHPLPFLKCFGNLQKSNSSLDHSLQHASSALSESQRATNHALQNLDVKHTQIINLEREKQEIAALISKFKSEKTAQDKEMSAVKSINQQLQDQNLKLFDKLKRIADAFKWTMT